MIIGYARTSTIDRSAGFEAQLQLKELEGVKCQKIFREQTSSVGIRLQLETALEFVRQDDVLVVIKLDGLPDPSPTL
jgi:DNA invertase Pin-like site-specific DNA recombinase